MHNGQNGTGKYEAAEQIDLGTFIKESQSDQFDIRDLFFQFWNRRWMILAISILSAAVAFVSTKFILPEFKSRGTMLIMESKSTSVASTDLTNLLKSSYGFGMGNSIQNELFYLQSRSFLAKVSTKLYNERFDRRGMQFPVLWKKFDEDSTLVGPDTVANRLMNKIVYTKGPIGSTVIMIEYLSYSRDEAKRVVDLVMDIYSEESTNQTRTSARSALDFLNKEKKVLTERLKNSEQELQRFMEREGVVELNEQTRLTIQELANLAARRQENEVKLVALEASFEHYKKQLEELKPGLGTMTSDVVSSLLVRYQYKIAELEAERLMITSRNRDVQNLANEPTMIRINNELNVLKAEVRNITERLTGTNEAFTSFLSNNDGNMAQMITGYRQKVTELQIEIQQIQLQNATIEKMTRERETFFESLPTNMTEMARKRRQLVQDEQLYLAIDRQAAETALWEQTQYGMGRVIDYGLTPYSAYFPKKLVFMLGGLLLGMFGSVFGIAVSARISSRINSIERLSKLRYPVLSVIDRFDETIRQVKNNAAQRDERFSPELVMVYDAISPAAESFRKLANNLMYAQPDLRKQTILITSSGKSEGKSTILANLAIALAESHKKVILVDLDLRRPRINELFPKIKSPGLLAHIFEDISLDEAISHGVLENLDILTIHKSVPNPVPLLKSEKLNSLIASLQERYDFVLIDSPPYGVIEDAAPLFSKVNGVLLSALFNSTSIFEMQHLIQNLHKVKAPILGIVLNGFDYRSSLDYKGYAYYKKTYSDYKKYA